MTRVLLLLLSLVGVAPVMATGFDDIPCPRYPLSRSQLQHLGAQVREKTGLRLERRRPHVCQQGEYISAFVTTRRAIDAQGAERWYEGQCESSVDLLPRWHCEYSAQRIVRIGGFERDGEAEVVIPLYSNARVIRRRLAEAFSLAKTLSAQNSCAAGPSTAQQLLEARSDLAFPWNLFQVALEAERFTLWTTRYAIHFTAETAQQPLRLRCWRPRTSPRECLGSACPA